MSLIFLFTLIGSCLLAAYGALIDYYRRAWLSVPGFDVAERTGSTRISVLVPARNEAENIAGCIRSLAAQTYPRDLYQVIVIDDHSTDSTAEIVEATRPQGLDLVLTRLGDPVAASSRPGDFVDATSPPGDPVAASSPPGLGSPAFKKLAIEKGVNIASGDLIVTTDADCRHPPDWLNTLAVFYREKQAKFIAAPVRMDNGMDNAPYTTLSIFQILDFITLQGITGASVSTGFHSMCNGANLAYEKAAFAEVSGFRDIDDIPSGDDMLLMHKIASAYPRQVFFLKSASATVSTSPERTWKGFIHQRIRWASKADRYRDRRIFRVLVLVYILNVALLALPAAAFWNGWWLWMFAIGLLAKTMLEFPFVSSVAGFFGQQRLMRWFFLLQPFHLLYTVVIGWMGKFGSYSWKGRTIKR